MYAYALLFDENGVGKWSIGFNKSVGLARARALKGKLYRRMVLSRREARQFDCPTFVLGAEKIYDGGGQ